MSVRKIYGNYTSDWLEWERTSIAFQAMVLLSFGVQAGLE